MAVKVVYAGTESKIHEATGLLLQPGVNEIADEDMAKALHEEGVVTLHVEANTGKPEKGKKGSAKGSAKGSEDEEAAE